MFSNSKPVMPSSASCQPSDNGDQSIHEISTKNAFTKFIQHYGEAAITNVTESAPLRSVDTPAPVT